MAKYSAVITPENVTIFNENGRIQLDIVPPKFSSITGVDGSDVVGSKIMSPMPGLLDKIIVKIGDNVKKGDPVAVIIGKLCFVFISFL